jgi:hypothetical protein
MSTDCLYKTFEPIAIRRRLLILGDLQLSIGVGNRAGMAAGIEPFGGPSEAAGNRAITEWHAYFSRGGPTGGAVGPPQRFVRHDYGRRIDLEPCDSRPRWRSRFFGGLGLREMLVNPGVFARIDTLGHGELGLLGSCRIDTTQVHTPCRADMNTTRQRGIRVMIPSLARRFNRANRSQRLGAGFPRRASHGEMSWLPMDPLFAMSDGRRTSQ